MNDTTQYLSCRANTENTIVEVTCISVDLVMLSQVTKLLIELFL